MMVLNLVGKAQMIRIIAPHPRPNPPTDPHQLQKSLSFTPTPFFIPTATVNCHGEEDGSAAFYSAVTIRKAWTRHVYHISPFPHAKSSPPKSCRSLGKCRPAPPAKLSPKGSQPRRCVSSSHVPTNQCCVYFFVNPSLRMSIQITDIPT